MVQVESEAILQIEYDPDFRRLFVRFTDGDWYTYTGVPAIVHQDFLAAPSHGRFFQAHVRDRYPYRKGR